MIFRHCACSIAWYTYKRLNGLKHNMHHSRKYNEKAQATSQPTPPIATAAALAQSLPFPPTKLNRDINTGDAKPAL